MGANSGRNSPVRFIVVLDNGGLLVNIPYRVDLNEAERAQLAATLSGGTHAVCKPKRAQILLAAHGGIGDEAIARSVSVSGSTVSGPNGALWKAAEAHRIVQRLEFRHIPKHAGWLNMVEIEIGVLRARCLDRRIGTRDMLVSEIAA